MIFMDYFSLDLLHSYFFAFTFTLVGIPLDIHLTPYEYIPVSYISSTLTFISTRRIGICSPCAENNLYYTPYNILHF